MDAKKHRRKNHGPRKWGTATCFVTLLVATTPAVAQQADFGTELFKKESWTVRLDNSSDPAGTLVETAGGTIRLSTETAALVWRPRDRSEGNFVVRGVIRLPARSDGGAGIFFGGYDLEGMDRNWAACMVRGGWYLVDPPPERRRVARFPLMDGSRRCQSGEAGRRVDQSRRMGRGCRPSDVPNQWN